MSVPTHATRRERVTPSRLRTTLPLLVMGLLYWLSSLPGSLLPGNNAQFALFHWVPPSVQNTLHVPAYATLAGAWFWALAAWPSVARLRLAGAFAIAVAYGLFDEWHQSFVPGRFASLTDVTLDFAGAVLGICLASWMDTRFGAGKPKTDSERAV